MTDLGQHFDTAKLLRYTLPVMGMLLLSSAYGIIDGLFVSNFAGKTAFASVTITMPFVMILSTVGMMMGSGGSALVGRLLGAGREREANGVFSLIAWATLAVGAIAAVLGVAFMGFTMLGSSVFTALGNGTISAVIAFVHTGLFEIGSVLLLPPLLGPESIWWAITVAEVAATALTAALLAAYGPRYGLLTSKDLSTKEKRADVD